MDLPQFDPKNRESILQLAKALEGRFFGELVDMASERHAASGHKGEFGNLVERLIFRVVPNNRDEPDLVEAGVEIKTAPLVDKSRAGRVPKERVVLGKIDFSQIVKEDFGSSKFLTKNRCLLLLFYLWQRGGRFEDYQFIRSILHEFSGEDLEIIRDDWEKIREKIESGRAHELSEGDTLYLGACTKGVDATGRVAQPNSPIRAKPRAFSLKPGYLRVILGGPRGLVKLPRAKKTTDFEKSVLQTLSAYHGYGERRLLKELNAGQDSRAKSRYRMLVNRMLDVPKEAKIEEFEKADLQVKTVRIQRNGSIKESMSFRNIDFFELLREDDWEESPFHADLTKRFLFCVFREGLGGEGYGFDRAFFWTMPVADLAQAEAVWRVTRERAAGGRYGELPGATENSVAHVRTKGRDSRDLTPTPDGQLVTKRCFWLNRGYVRSIMAAAQG